MKIRYAKDEEKLQLKAFWQEAFAFDDGGYTDYYFDCAYDFGKHLVLTLDNEIVSMLSSHKDVYMFNNRLLSTSMIVGVATKEPYKHQGYMTALMNEALDILEHQELLTLIQAYNPKLYQPFGFEIVYRRHTYHFRKDRFHSQGNQLLTKDYTVEDLLTIYGRFTKHFSGFKVRTAQDFALYIKEIDATNQFIQAFYDHSHELIRGYIVFSIENDLVKIDECVYLDLKTLDAMLSFALELADHVDLTVSEYEDLSRVYEGIKLTVEDYTMVRINDYDLWNRLFDSNVDNVKDALEIINKPLFMHESI